MIFKLTACINGKNTGSRSEVFQPDHEIEAEFEDLDCAASYGLIVAKDLVKKYWPDFTSLAGEVYIAKLCESGWVDQHCVQRAYFEANKHAMLSSN